jgi:hypothetical protein
MQKKDYELIAEAIHELRGSGITNGSRLEKVKDKLIEILEPKLKEDNPNFDIDIFTEYIEKLD